MSTLYQALSTALLLCIASAAGLAREHNSSSDTTAAGMAKSAKTKALETGAKLLKSNSPLKDFDIYLVGFHPMKDHPELQM